MISRSLLTRTMLLLGLAGGLAACENAVAPPPPVSAGGFGSLSRSNDWGFGMRTQTPGFTFDRGGSGAGA
jgi:hypothetical protein